MIWGLYLPSNPIRVAIRGRFYFWIGRREQPLAVDGILDLSDWDFEKDGIVELKGEWRFVWEEFVEPMPSDVFRIEDLKPK